jgi:hypothetical protein
VGGIDVAVFWKRWLVGKKEIPAEHAEALRLFHDIRQAQQEWAVAQERLNYALDVEQIDYAISHLETTEKRYAMLLRQAKKVDLNMMELYNYVGQERLYHGKSVEG